ncbi:TOX high mobility group box family member 2 isoform X4 [Balaenoptera musculus]|uniref:TOX high mobility group box family member 2 isoform X4 n=1 Tax=Balaenoptera musculus TaxID=9771 RepID=A0A8B8VE57_BALMU|nr:TOX high mobility group box family member 2 isoform X4 [Balaenoptera musculus]
MDVRLYPSAPAVGARPGAEPASLAPLDYYHCGKFDGESAYVGMSDGNPELLSTSQTYNSQNESNEDYEIPPITPPNLPEPSLLHLGDHEAGYHSLCHGLTPNGLLPAYSYQAMDLPAIMVSNMLAQDSHLLSGQLPTMSGEKRPSADPGRKAKNPKKKKKKDPNEPQKPVSAYALFFRDTQAAIKGQNPSATFGDVSKIVASMWDSLGEEQKQAYKRKTEAAKKEYLKALAAYRASLVSKSSPDQGETKSTQANPPAKMLPPKQPVYAMPGLASFLTPSDLQAFRGGASPASLARTLGSKSLLPGLSASPPPPPSFPLSTPLHQQLPLPPHTQGTLLSPPVSMSPAPQPPILPAPMALQVQLAVSPSPPGPQDFPHISEFPSGSGSRSPGPSNPTSSGDWDSSYPSGECGISTCRLCRGSAPPAASPKTLQEPSAP